VARIFFRIFSHGSNIEIPSSHHLGDFWQQNYAEVEGLVHIALKQAKFAVTPFIIRLEHLFLMGDRFQKLEKPSGSAYPGDIFDYPESATPSWSCRTPRLRRFAFVCIVCSVFFSCSSLRFWLPCHPRRKCWKEHSGQQGGTPPTAKIWHRRTWLKSCKLVSTHARVFPLDSA